MNRRAFCTSVGVIAVAGCQEDETAQRQEVVRIDERLTSTESFQFDVAEDEGTEITVHVREEGSAEVGLIDRRADQVEISDTVTANGSSAEETYSPSLESGVVYGLTVAFEDNVVDVTVTSFR